MDLYERMLTSRNSSFISFEEDRFSVLRDACFTVCCDLHFKSVNFSDFMCLDASGSNTKCGKGYDSFCTRTVGPHVCSFSTMP